LSQSNDFTCWPSIVTASRSSDLAERVVGLAHVASNIGTILNTYRRRPKFVLDQRAATRRTAVLDMVILVASSGTLNST
jgi:hypothetical protein